jgi:hypothetical protein
METGAAAAASEFEETTRTEVASLRLCKISGSGQEAVMSEGAQTFARSNPWTIADAIFPAPMNAYFMP